MTYPGVFETESSLTIQLDKVLDITHFKVSRLLDFWYPSFLILNSKHPVDTTQQLLWNASKPALD